MISEPLSYAGHICCNCWFSFHFLEIDSSRPICCVNSTTRKIPSNSLIAHPQPHHSPTASLFIHSLSIHPQPLQPHHSPTASLFIHSLSIHPQPHYSSTVLVVTHSLIIRPQSYFSSTDLLFTHSLIIHPQS
jgi:hypothetical protein